MGYTNGRIPATALRTISPGNQLLSSAANAYKVLVLLGEVAGIAVKPAAGVGSAYRDIAMQTLYWQASRGVPAAMKATSLNPGSSVAVAAPGYSSHGDGRKIDLLFNGSANPSSTELALANHCGFTRQFGADDPNHFQHDGVTAISGPNTADWNRIVCHYLNGRQLGEQSTTVRDGKVDKRVPQRYTWELQAAGILDRLYPSPPFKHDGVFGPKTETLEQHYRTVLWASV